MVLEIDRHMNNICALYLYTSRIIDSVPNSSHILYKPLIEVELY